MAHSKASSPKSWPTIRTRPWLHSKFKPSAFAVRQRGTSQNLSVHWLCSADPASGPLEEADAPASHAPSVHHGRWPGPATISSHARSCSWVESEAVDWVPETVAWHQCKPGSANHIGRTTGHEPVPEQSQSEEWQPKFQAPNQRASWELLPWVLFWVAPRVFSGEQDLILASPVNSCWWNRTLEFPTCLLPAVWRRNSWQCKHFRRLQDRWQLHYK